MTTQITTAFVNGYRGVITQLVQQHGSILRPFVRQESQNSEKEFFDRVGETNVAEYLSRYADSPLISTPHDRRMVTLRQWHWGELIDNFDKLKMLTDPTSIYNQNAKDAAGRQIDDLIIEAALGTAYSGKEGTTPVSFPGGSTNQVDVNYVDSGSPANSGLTVAKLRQARKLIRKNTKNSDFPLNIAVGAEQIDDLLKETTVTSADFNTVKPLMNGDVTRFLGFNIIPTERLPVDGSGYRRIIAWAQPHLMLSTGADIMVNIAPRADKSFNMYTYLRFAFGATRMEEAGVIEVKCAE